MNTATSIFVLFLAALLEAAGDALMRKGIHSAAFLRIGFFLAGGLALAAYGYTVNAPPWDFGRLIGVYVVFFFLVAQAINWIVFHQPPSGRILLASVLMIAGASILSAPL